jgi:SAM-dependent methyltransferase
MQQQSLVQPLTAAGRSTRRGSEPFERLYLALEYCLPPLGAIVRRRLRAIAASQGGHARILDVGGRKSHYTIGVDGSIVVTDLPRRSQIQHNLHLGVTDELARQLRRRRSNIQAIAYDDMTRSGLRDGVFDCVVAVEVLEHVEQDAEFVREVWRVLKPGGTFLMTTPNGDVVPNTNPDHKRHYTSAQLSTLLAATFGNATVDFAVRRGRCHDLGLRSWSARRPVRTAVTMAANMVNHLQSAAPGLARRARVTNHLVAEAVKAR